MGTEERDEKFVGPLSVLVDLLGTVRGRVHRDRSKLQSEVEGKNIVRTD